MDAACVKRSLVKQIQKLSEHPELYCRDPGRDFTRKRKLSFCTLISFILNMRGGPLTSEIIDFFSNEKSIVSSSAVVQMRDKLKPEAFRSLLINFNSQMENMEQPETENGLRILAVDGSDIQMPMDPDDEDSFYPGANGQKPYNLIHLNALYDLLQRRYLDAVIQKSRKQNEHKALIELAESSPIEKALVIVDRGYESYNTFAHIHERGWFYLARIKDGKNGIVSGLDLPADQYPSERLKELYALRWGIETSFRSLKYTVGMLHFHSKKAECIFQEVYAALIVYNFTEWITAQVIVHESKRKHTYKVNFSAAVHICRNFLAEKMHPPDVE